MSVKCQPRIFLVLLTGFFIATPASLPAVDKPVRRFEFKHQTMGVDWWAILYACDERQANNAARAAFGRVDELNAILSDYQETSELRRLSTASHGEWRSVSRELFLIVNASQKLSRETSGAFDITVGPLTKLWRRAHRRKEFPDRERLVEARAATGFRNLKVNATNRTVKLGLPGMRLDAGGIAKGYAADEALRILKLHGIVRALVDASGDIVAGDPPPGRATWVVEVASLRVGEEAPAEHLAISNQAVATSGDAYQHVEIDGKRYSHIVDPTTGLGLTRSSSVTVIAPTGLQADSLASAVSVLGPEKGIRYVDRHRCDGIEAYVLTDDNERKEVRSSRGFQKYRAFNE